MGLWCVDVTLKRGEMSLWCVFEMGERVAIGMGLRCEGSGLAMKFIIRVENVILNLTQKLES